MRRGVPAIRVGGQLVTTVLDLTLAHYGVAREGLPGEWPAGYDDPGAVHAGVAGADHRRRRPAGRARGARVRPQRRGDRGALDDRDGRRHQPLVPLRSDLPDVPGAGDAVRLRGRQRRRLGALRRPGEGAAADGLADDRVRARLGAPAAPSVGHAVLLPGHRPVALRALSSPRDLASPLGRGLLDGRHIVDVNALGRAAGVAAVVSELRPLHAGPGRRGRARGRRPGRLRGVGAAGRAGCASPARTPTPRRTTRRC